MCYVISSKILMKCKILKFEFFNSNICNGHIYNGNICNGHIYNGQIRFAKSQESARKDVERAFGVLQARFSIVRGPACLRKLEVLKDIMKACIILHNMIVEDERNANEFDFTYDTMDERPTATVIPKQSSELLKFINTQHCIRDKEIHFKLQADLVEHQWNMHGNY